VQGAEATLTTMEVKGGLLLESTVECVVVGTVERGDNSHDPTVMLMGRKGERESLGWAATTAKKSINARTRVHVQCATTIGSFR